MKYILLAYVFCMAFAQAAEEEEETTLDSLGYKSAFEYILNKNFKTVKSGSFAVTFQHDKVILYSVTNCSKDYTKVDAVSYATGNVYEKDKWIDRYVSYIDFSLTDKYSIPLRELNDYYLCFIDREGVTTFMYTGGENSRGGGPLYIIDNKNNKLLEVHYMQ